MILKTGIGLGGFLGKIDALDSYLEKGCTSANCSWAI